MLHDVKAISKKITGEEDPARIDDNALQQIVARYPYFGAARFLAAAHDPRSAEKSVTASLYFDNPLRLSWLLTDDSEDSPQPDTPVESGVHYPDEAPDAMASGEITIEPEALDFEAADSHVEQSSGNDYPEPPIATGSNEMPSADVHTSHEAEVAIAHPVLGGHVAPEEEADVAATAQPQATARDDNNDTSATEGSAPENQPARSTDESPIAFQSYHTIDYFASQGIRLQSADLPRDRLGQQLKSFTEWLRSMKKLPASEAEIPADEGRHSYVMQSAAHSLEAREVLTEAMAEVWLKQGHVDKAVEIYHKLSLQNPGKSDYFAAKIEQIKAS